MFTTRRPVRGCLISVGVSPQIVIDFQFNPTNLADKRTANYAPLAAPGALLPSRQYTSGGDRTLTFTCHDRRTVRRPAGRPENRRG